MKWWWGVLFATVLFASAGVVYWLANYRSTGIVSPVVNQILEKPLGQYTIEALSSRDFGMGGGIIPKDEWKSEIILDKAVATTSAYEVREFHFLTDRRKEVTGLAHIPSGCDSDSPCPVIVQFRGYVDVDRYSPGVGTEKTAAVFARDGFISLAPDFLGYGGSDSPSEDVFAARFETWTTALNLLAAAKKWPWANGQIGLWGHSNGGQIALTVLEISSQSYPTVLWAPVSKPFPYSILYYTDEADDRGKLLRRRLAEFERDYDVFLYDLTRYWDRIVAPIQIHQGTADEAVPKKWSDELVDKLQELDKEVNYSVYPGADHNLVGVWNTVVQRDIRFFKKHF